MTPPCRFIAWLWIGFGFAGLLGAQSAAPSIQTQPSGRMAIIGDAVSLTVVPAGTGAFTYQWYRNGAPLGGATAATYVITRAGAGDAGSYTVVVGNGAGTVTSSAAVLGVYTETSARHPDFWEDFYLLNTASSPSRTIHDGAGHLYTLWSPLSVDADVVGGLTVGRLVRLDESTGMVDPSFQWDEQLGSPLFLCIQPDGKLLVAVSFAGGEQMTVVRLKADGSRDAGYSAPWFRHSIRFLTLQADGRLIVAATDGSTSTVTHAGSINDAYPTVCRLLPDGSLDNSFSPAQLNDGGYVLAPPVLDSAGRVYLGGRFTTVNGQASVSLARLLADGTLDGTFAGHLPAGWSATNYVRGLGLQSDGHLVVAGRLIYAAKGSTANPVYAVRFNADDSFDSTFAQPTYSTAGFGNGLLFYPRAMVMAPDDNFYVVTDRILHFSPTGVLDTAWPLNTLTDGILTWLSRSPTTGNLYLPAIGAPGKDIDAYSSAGAVLPGFAPGGFGVSKTPDSAVGLKDGRVLAAGTFNHYGPAGAPGSVVFSVAGAPLTSATPFNDPTTVVSNPSVSVFRWPDGSFGIMRANGLVTGLDMSASLTRYLADGTPDPAWAARSLTDPSQWHYTPCPDGSLLVWSGSPTAQALVNDGSAAWMQRLRADGSVDTTFAPLLSSLYSIVSDAVNGRLITMGMLADVQVAADGGIILLCVDVTGGISLRKLQRSGAVDPVYANPALGASDSGSSGYTAALVDPVTHGEVQYAQTVYATDAVPRMLVFPDGTACVAGVLTVGGQARNLARFTATGTLDPGLPDISLTYSSPMGLPPRVTGLALDDYGRIYLTGRFHTVNGRSAPGLVRSNAQGQIDTAWSPGIEVRDPLLYGTVVVADHGWLNLFGRVAAAGETLTGGFERLALDATAPVILGSSPDQAVASGQSITLFAGAYGGAGATCQWTHDGVVITGATGTTLSLAPLNYSTLGSYQLTITNSLGSATSPLIAVTATNLAPSLKVSPAGQAVAIGDTVSLSVVAAGTTPFTYLWYHNGSMISGADTDTYVISSAKAGDVGSYSVQVNNSFGFVLSASATLTVSARTQTITFAGPADQPFGFTPLSLTATASSGLPVTLSLDSGPATLSGTSLTLTGAGVVTLRASQAGNAQYSPAPDVVRSFAVQASGFDFWRLGSFTAGELADAAKSGPLAVYGQDGLSNLLKYALGLSPKANASAGAASLTASGGQWVYTYVKPAAVTDVSLTVESSTDLSTWNLLTSIRTDTTNGMETWQATTPAASTPNVYFRLKVTQ